MGMHHLPAVSGNITHLVWRNVEGFIRNPGPVLQQLAKRMKGLGGSRGSREDEVAETMRLFQSKAAENDRILAQYRCGRIDDRTLGKQMDEIGAAEHPLSYAERRVIVDAGRTRRLRERLPQVVDARTPGTVPVT